jgi:hypothetical protein
LSDVVPRDHEAIGPARVLEPGSERHLIVRQLAEVRRRRLARQFDVDDAQPEPPIVRADLLYVAAATPLSSIELIEHIRLYCQISRTYSGTARAM